MLGRRRTIGSRVDDVEDLWELLVEKLSSCDAADVCIEQKGFDFGEEGVFPEALVTIGICEQAAPEGEVNAFAFFLPDEGIGQCGAFLETANGVEIDLEVDLGVSQALACVAEQDAFTETTEIPAEPFTEDVDEPCGLPEPDDDDDDGEV